MKWKCYPMNNKAQDYLEIVESRSNDTVPCKCLIYGARRFGQGTRKSTTTYFLTATKHSDQEWKIRNLRKTKIWSREYKPSPVKQLGGESQEQLDWLDHANHWQTADTV